MPVQKGPADWSQKNIADFWNWYSSKPAHGDEYFSKQAGAGIVRLLRLSGRWRGKVLDYGCGPGFLLNHLLAIRDFECFGLDFSRESVELANRRFSAKGNWHGAIHCASLPSSYKDRSFDIISCIETIEHVMPDQLPALFGELKRLIAPGGTILLTTPNNENLDERTHYCPFCNAEFHHMQHLRSFTEASLTALLRENGFSVNFCKAVNLLELLPRPGIRFKDLSASETYGLIKQGIRTIRYALSPHTLTDYFAINPPRHELHLCALCTVEKQ